MFRYITLVILSFITIYGISQQYLVGEKAPEIKVDNWIYPNIQVDDWNFKEVPEDLEGKTIILDLWFTKCAPCVASIPKLNMLVKKFPDIIFLSLTFENDSVIREFLDRMIMYYPVASYPEDKLIDEFGVCGYPTTYLIDKNGIIIWVGSPFELNEKMLRSILNKEYKNDISIDKRSLESPEIEMAYEFSIKEHNMKMNNASYTHSYPYDITIFNKSLISILNNYYHINKSRIISKDTAFLNKRFDISLKADPDLTTQSNCKPMLKYLIEENLNFTMNKTEIDTEFYNIEIINDSLLNNYKSNEVGFGSWNNGEYIDLKGASLQQLQDYMENSFNVIVLISDKVNEGDIYDLSIPTDSFKNAKDILFTKYGILLSKKHDKVEFWEIDR